MRALDYLEPLPVYEPGESLETALDALRKGTPVAFPEGGGWRVVRPIDAVALPVSRQLCDVPSRRLATLGVDQDIDLRRLTENDIWGATKNETLVGRVDSLRVVTALADVSLRDAERELALQARDRLMPKLLHDLANALVVAAAVQGGDASSPSVQAATAAIRHSNALVSHMRNLYASGRGYAEEVVRLDVLLRRVEPMLSVAASPATVWIAVDGDPTIRCHRWRLESVLLNLVLNAGELATNIYVRVVDVDADTTTIRVEDDGPGFPDRVAPASPAGSQALHGHGLRSIRRQVAVMGGTLTLGSSTQGGASVVIELPRAS